jgi:hypothetical protein
MKAQLPHVVMFLCLAFNAIIGYYVFYIICRNERAVLPKQMVSASPEADIKTVP